jgi:hypothetical protein
MQIFIIRSVNSIPFLQSIHSNTATMSVETEYKLENVAATSVPSAQIDATFKSSTIGEYLFIY